MKACKISKNIVIIYFLTLALVIQTGHKDLVKAESTQVDNSTLSLQNDTKEENENLISQPPDSDQIQILDDLNPLSFRLDTPDIAFNQEVKIINQATFSNHFSSPEDFRFIYDQVVPSNSNKIEFEAFSVFDFQVEILEDSESQSVVFSQDFSHTNLIHQFELETTQENYLLAFRVPAGEFSIQSIKFEQVDTEQEINILDQSDSSLVIEDDSLDNITNKEKQSLSESTDINSNDSVHIVEGNDSETSDDDASIDLNDSDEVTEDNTHTDNDQKETQKNQSQESTNENPLIENEILQEADKSNTPIQDEESIETESNESNPIQLTQTEEESTLEEVDNHNPNMMNTPQDTTANASEDIDSSQIETPEQTNESSEEPTLSDEEEIQISDEPQDQDLNQKDETEAQGQNQEDESEDIVVQAEADAENQLESDTTYNEDESDLKPEQSSASSSSAGSSSRSTQASTDQASSVQNQEVSNQVDSSFEFSSNVNDFDSGAQANESLTGSNNQVTNTNNQAGNSNTRAQTHASSQTLASSSQQESSKSNSNDTKTDNSYLESHKSQLQGHSLTRNLNDSEFVAQSTEFIDYSKTKQEQKLDFDDVDVQPNISKEISPNSKSEKPNIIIAESEFSLNIPKSQVLSAQNEVSLDPYIDSEIEKKPKSTYPIDEKHVEKKLPKNATQVDTSLQNKQSFILQSSAKKTTNQTLSTSKNLSKSLQASLFLDSTKENSINPLPQVNKSQVITHSQKAENRLLKTKESGCNQSVCSPLNKFSSQNTDLLEEYGLILDLDPSLINSKSISNFLVSGSSHAPNTRVELYIQRAVDHTQLLASKLTDSKGDFYFIVDSTFQDHKQYKLFAKTKTLNSPIYLIETDFQKPIMQYPPDKFCGKTLEESKLQCAFNQAPTLEFDLPEHLYLEVLYNSEVTKGEQIQSIEFEKTLVQPSQNYLKTLKTDSNHRVIYIVRDKNNPDLASSPVVINFKSYLPLINPISVPLFIFTSVIGIYILFQTINLRFRKNEQEIFAQANIDL